MSSSDVCNEFDVAILGLSGRFPGASTVDEFWSNLCAGVESIRSFTDAELLAAGVPPELVDDPRFVKAAPVLDAADCFDARFFGYSPLEAELMDPQQRLFLECCHGALEHAGYDPDRFPGPIGVFAGSAMNTYLLFSGILPRFTSDYLQTLVASDKDFLSTKVSYKLNLRGPSLTVQTACSTSLVAVHLACQSLLNRECDMALAGAMAIRVPLATGHLHTEGSVFSRDGHCRPFDARANGTIFGSGGGVVTLRRLSDAIEAGDTIHAVIKGSAINNDGSTKSEYTAPSVGRQADVVAEALGAAGVDADTIGYLESHGTGTYLGDPIEVAALTRAFRESTERNQFCALGSVKSNIGHLDAAAGIASLIKTTLALRHKQIPPTVHFETPNPEIDLASSPFFVNNQTLDWAAGDTPRRAGVSSLGIGGTNAHVVLEEAREVAVAETPRGDQLLLVSARTEQARGQIRDNLARELESSSAPALEDVAFTLAVGRAAGSERFAAVCGDAAEAVSVLHTPPTRSEGSRPNLMRRPVFLFPGQGAQYVDMGRGLYESAPVYREQFDRCLDLFRGELSGDLREFVFPRDSSRADAAKQLAQTEFTQPALFCVEYALARQLMAWGVQPAGLVGHSIGELVATAVAEALSLEEAVQLVALRGRLMQSMPRGGMLAVHLGPEETAPLLPSQLSVAAINSPRLTVVSGPSPAIEEFTAKLTERGVAHRTLATSHAFHSQMMEPLVDRFAAEVSKVRWSEPQIPILSTVLGDWAQPQQIQSPAYWQRNVRDTVRFSACVESLLADPAHVLIEVGPGTTLSMLVRQHGEAGRHASVVSMTRHPQQEASDRRVLLQSLGELWLNGVDLDWEAFYHGEGRRRVPLPTYPFERTRHWPTRVDAPNPKSDASRSSAVRFGARRWTKRGNEAQPVVASERDGPSQLILFGKQDENLTALVRALRETSSFPVRIAGNENELEFYLANASSDSAVTVCYWAVTESSSPEIAVRQTAEVARLCSVIERGRAKHYRLALLSTNGFDVDSPALINPTARSLAALAPVITQEIPHAAGNYIDLPTRVSGAILQALAQELAYPSDQTVVAIRDGNRWDCHFEELDLSHDEDWSPSGVVLITGGLGDLGYHVAKKLAEIGANLALVGRQSREGLINERSQRLRQLQNGRTTVEYFSTDVSRPECFPELIDAVESKVGAVSVIIHAAGILDRRAFSRLSSLSLEDVRRQFAPKANAAEIVSDVVCSRNVERVVVFSSVSALLGGSGFGAYAAANAYMDAVASRENAGSCKWLSINWDAWRDTNTPSREKVESGIPEEWQLTPAAAQDAVVRLLSHTGDDQLAAVVDPSIRLASRSANTPASQTKDSLAASASPACGEGIREQLLEVWIERLGVDHIDAEDNFFELGGTSLVAVQVLSDLRARFGVELSPRAIYDAQTVGALSRIVEEQQPAQQTASPVGDVERQLQEVWVRRLGIVQIDREDNFFELGGTSLVAVQVLADLQAELGVSLSPRSLFDAQTIRELAAMISRETTDGRGRSPAGAAQKQLDDSLRQLGVG